MKAKAWISSAVVAMAMAATPAAAQTALPGDGGVAVQPDSGFPNGGAATTNPTSPAMGATRDAPFASPAPNVGRLDSNPDASLPGVGLSAAPATQQRGAGGLQNQVGAIGTMVPSTSGYNPVPIN